MAETPAQLSQGTHMTGILLAPPLQQTALDRIELVPLGDGRALAVVVTETGWVTTQPISVEARLTLDDLREMGRSLTRRFRGKTFQAILDDIAAPADPLDPLWTRGRALLDQVVAVLRARTLYVSGALNMLDHPDLSDVATVRRLLHAFEEKARLIDLLSRIAQERGVQIVIGAENPVEEMREVSLVASTYSYRDQVLGRAGGGGPAPHGLLGRHLHRGRDRPARLELAVARPPRALPALLTLPRAARPSAILGDCHDRFPRFLRRLGAGSTGAGAAAEPEAELARLREALEAKSREADATHDRYLRTVAEFDNARKRAVREREELIRGANESLIRELLPVLDNFERALQAARGDAGAAARHRRGGAHPARAAPRAGEVRGDRVQPRWACRSIRSATRRWPGCPRRANRR